ASPGWLPLTGSKRSYSVLKRISNRRAPTRFEREQDPVASRASGPIHAIFAAEPEARHQGPFPGRKRRGQTDSLRSRRHSPRARETTGGRSTFGVTATG